MAGGRAKSVEVLTNLPGIGDGGRWLALAPSTETLIVTSKGSSIDPDIVPPSFRGLAEVVPASVDLVRLVLAGPALRSHRYPAMPSLTTLELYVVDLSLSGCLGLS